MYAAVKQEYEDSFMNCLNYWKEKVRKNPEDFDKSKL